jgi:carboxylesterase
MRTQRHPASEATSRLAMLLAAGLLVLGGCGDAMEYEDHWLDGPEVFDPSLNDPDYLLSTRPGITAADLTRPVIIAAHGFTASTFEWKEFREYAEAHSDVLVSLVLLGGHGRTLEEFRESTWDEWGAPILAEYDALRTLGYRNISLAGSSTSAALMLEHLARGRYGLQEPAIPGQPHVSTPGHFFFIDPIVLAGDKNLSLLPVLQYLISHTMTPSTEEETPHWYQNRPAEALAQLQALTSQVRRRLASGITLPEGTKAKVYKTTRDETADPVSALLIYRGLRTANGGRVDVEMIESGHHVFTRLRARNPATVSPADVERQQRAFQDMIGRVTAP